MPSCCNELLQDVNKLVAICAFLAYMQNHRQTEVRSKLGNIAVEICFPLKKKELKISAGSETRVETRAERGN